ncbi:RsmE family RNA methyltransferase [Candidatus Babeliales bacterium]|nr:RsmE family RNA methyltransferase [Candidatus Babeliales bacterium]
MLDCGHEFAFYTQGPLPKEETVLDDPILVRRIITVVRLHPDEHFILFNASHSVRCRIIKLVKRTLTIAPEKLREHIVYTPKVTAVVPLLKREALEQTIYSLVELGVNDIQLIITAKSQQELRLSTRQRLERIMIAAAEQSKHFALPHFSEVAMLEELLQLNNVAKRILFDPDGRMLWDVMSDIRAVHVQHVVCMIGPEGALTTEERQRSVDAGYVLCALTPTVLRSSQACSLGIGVVRALLRTR